MPTPTYELLSSNTVGAGNAANITFSNIPQTYRDLIVRISSRQNSSTATYQIYFTLNGSSSNYSRLYWLSNGIGTDIGSASGETIARFAWAESSTFTSNTFNNVDLYIPNYTLNKSKNIQADGVCESNGGFVYAISMYTNQWANTDPITSITIAEISGSLFVQYTSAYLYGLKNT